jgi:hypothetical protein
MASNIRAVSHGVKPLSIGIGGFCACLVSGVLLGCGGGHDTDDSHNETSERVCEGDQFAGDDPSLIAGCAVLRGNLIFTSNALLDAELPNLTHVDGSFAVWGNGRLTRVNMPRLEEVGGYLLIEANELLTNVDLPVLAKVNERAFMHLVDFSISGNPLLPMCQAEAVRDRLLAHGFHGSVKLSDNLGTCPQ